MTSIDLTVVVMAYNEAATLAATCEELLGAIARTGCSHEMLIIDDGSSDGTSEIADELSRTMPGTRVVHHRPNRGLGGVYRTGFEEAGGEFLTFFPADGQFPAAIIEDFYPRVQHLDLVLGYLPRRPGGLGVVLSAIERALYRALLGPMPRFQGIMMIRRKLLRDTDLASKGRGWAVVMEFVLKAARSGARIESVATTVRPRTHGESKVNNWRTILANVRQLITLRRHLREAGALQ
jgi:glycosyltransferase involved in cell wall biosynthesis